MTAHRVAMLYCDADRPACIEVSGDGSIGQSQTVAEARAVAQHAGWHRTRDGRDICPSCWQDGAR